MATVAASVFIGPDDKVETFDVPATGGSGRMVGLRVDRLTIQFRSWSDANELHESILPLLDALTELEAAAYARLQDDAA